MPFQYALTVSNLCLLLCFELHIYCLQDVKRTYALSRIVRLGQNWLIYTLKWYLHCGASSSTRFVKLNQFDNKFTLWCCHICSMIGCSSYRAISSNNAVCGMDGALVTSSMTMKTKIYIEDDKLSNSHSPGGATLFCKIDENETKRWKFVVPAQCWNTEPIRWTCSMIWLHWVTLSFVNTEV